MATEHLVIMAAGRGTRMGPLTANRPKAILPVAGKPLMQHLLDGAQVAGFQRITIIVHAMANQVQEAFGDAHGNVPITYVDQGEPKGTGHAVASLAGHVDGPFVLASGDSYLSADDLGKLAGAKGNAVGGQNVADARAYGLLDVNGEHVQGIAEKPDGEGPVPGPVNAGAYRFENDIIERCAALTPSSRGELELTDAVTGLASSGNPALFVEVPSWKEAGRPWELLDLQAHIMQGLEGRIDGEVSDQAELIGPVVIEKGAKVLGATRIEGPAIIGADAVIGPNAYIRPSTSIGAGCHIGNHCEIKNSIIGNGSNVPHLSYVGDSVMGSGCNLGAGTQVANLKVNDRNVRVQWNGEEWMDTGRRKLGVMAGDGVKTGVNCSINPGTILEEKALIGAGQDITGWIHRQD